MSTDRFDDIVRDVLLERAPAETPPELRARVAAVPGEVRQPRRASRLLEMAAAVVAAVIVGGTLLGLIGLRGLTVGPAPAVIPTPPPMSAFFTGGVRLAGLIDAEHGWAYVADHLVMTDDGGAHWRDITPPTSALSFLGNPKGVAFTDPEHGWVAVAETFASDMDQSYGRVDVWRTDDGGRSWSPVQLPKALVNNIGYTVPDVQFDFLDAEHGFALLSGSDVQGPGDSDLYWTADGGRTWSPDRPTGSGRSGITGYLAFASATNGAIVYRGLNAWDVTPRVAVTRDGGMSWRTVPLPLPTACSSGSWAGQPRLFADGSGVLTVHCTTTRADGGTIFFVTNDAGATWSRAGMLAGDDAAVAVISPQHWVALPWATGQPPVVRRTANAGQSWSTVALAGPAFGAATPVQFVDPEVGWAVVPDNLSVSDGHERLWATADGGATWHALDPASALSTPPPSPAPTFGPAAPGGSVPPTDARPWAGLSLRALDQAPTYPATLASWDGGYLALHDGTSDFGAWISRDGRSWTALARGTFGQASIGIAAGAGGRVFAVTQTFDGTEQAWVSTDGMHWSATPGGCPPIRTSGEEQLAGTAVGLIAVTDDPQYQLAFTADGASWTTVALPGAGLDSVQAVAAIGDTFVAVGSLGTNSLTSHSTPAAWWSTDGVHWSVARVAAHPGDGLYRVAAGGSGLVAVSLTPGGTPGRGSFWTSPDGRGWDLSDADPLGTWTPAVGGPGVEGSANGVFTGDGTRILGYGTRDLSKGLEYWSSADGTNWNRLALSGGPAGGADGQPFLLRDGVLFVGPNGTWFGQAAR